MWTGAGLLSVQMFGPLRARHPFRYRGEFRMATFSTTSFAGPRTVARRLGAATATAALVAAGVVGLGSAAHADEVTHTFWSPSGTNWTVPPGEIGRASCRERAEACEEGATGVKQRREE